MPAVVLIMTMTAKFHFVSKFDERSFFVHLLAHLISFPLNPSKARELHKKTTNFQFDFLL